MTVPICFKPIFFVAAEFPRAEPWRDGGVIPICRLRSVRMSRELKPSTYAIKKVDSHLKRIVLVANQAGLASPIRKSIRISG